MKIAYASDLHFEFHRDEPDWLPPLPQDADVLVLAGDIDNGLEAIQSIERMSEALPTTEIVFVAGNHEFYNENHEKLLGSYRSRFKKIPRAHFLENDSVTLDGITFLGCTLWSGFDAFPEFSMRDSMNAAAPVIPDFRLIRTQLNHGLGATLSPSRIRGFYERSQRWLERELQENTPESTVVVTHFPPHPQLRHGKIPHGILSNYFTANCQNLIEQYQPALWIYGHNHWCDELQCGTTRLLSNQLGYPQEEGHIREYLPRTVEL